MKKIKYLLITIIGLGLLYFIISYLMIIIFTNGNNHFIQKHYFKYKNIEDARKKKGLEKENISFKLVGFNKEQEKLIRENIFIYITKSNFQTFYGFWINTKNEDKDMLRLNLEIKSANSLTLLPNWQIHFKNNYSGWIYGCSLNLSRKEKYGKLDVIEYENNKPIKLGEIIVELN